MACRVREEGRTLDNQIRAENTHSRDTNTCLGSSVGSAETCEDDGRRAAHRTKEGLVDISMAFLWYTSCSKREDGDGRNGSRWC